MRLPNAGVKLLRQALSPLTRRAPRFCHNFPAWCLQHEIGLELLEEGGWIERRLPAAGERLPEVFLEHLRHWQPPRYLAGLRRAQICGTNGYVVLPDGCFLVEVAWEPRHIRCHPAYFKRPRFRPERKSGTYFSCFLFWFEGYYHWIHDVLARLHGVLERLPEETLFLVPPRMEGWRRRSLELAGVPPDRWVEYEGEVPWELERLFYATPAAHVGNHNPRAVQWLGQVFREKAGCGDAPPDLRIHVSRAGAGCRRLANETDLEAVFREYGYRTVLAEELPFDEQVRLFARATRVAGCHGAGLSNVVFASAGGRLLEFFEPTVVRPCYWSLANAMNFRYGCLVGESSPNPVGDPNMMIDPALLRRSLDELEAPGGRGDGPTRISRGPAGSRSGHDV